jgi:AraC family transcriptional regulator of adaptative response / DNA-3-methyladenine glycosylase II
MSETCQPIAIQGYYEDRMDLNPARCYRAVLSRDRRFDGRFFGGVVTTGVYCRPVCPVHPPKPENVRWFPSAAAAEAAGFRPCRRCRPETSPGTPAWMGTSATVSRALRLIAEGALDEEDVEALAARLGLSSRQLRRLFIEHLGAAPVAVARARRVHFAAKLLAETHLPITHVALSAGFRSIRQFNHDVRATFEQTPTQLRARRNGHGPESADYNGNGSGLIVRLPYRPPFDWASVTGFLKARATPGVEAVQDDVYRRTILIEGMPGTIEVWPADNQPCLLMRVRLAGYEHLRHVVERVRRVFDLGADPLQITTHLRRSPVLRPLVDAHPGMRIPGAWEAFELAVRAVLGQQVTVRGATTLAGRLVQAFGTPIASGIAGLSHVFPQPEVLAEADLARIGLPRARAATIRALAAAVSLGGLSLDAALGLDDAVSRLRAVRGIGAPWESRTRFRPMISVCAAQ